MHSTIFQVSKKTMEQDDHLSQNDIAEYYYGKFGIDYIGDERDDDDGFGELEYILPKEMFSINRNNRSLTINHGGTKEILKRILNAIRGAANKLNEHNITNWLETYWLKNTIENYLGGDSLFYYEDELMPLNQFIKDIAADDDVTTLYVGAMLDYHV